MVIITTMPATTTTMSSTSGQVNKSNASEQLPSEWEAVAALDEISMEVQAKTRTSK